MIDAVILAGGKTSRALADLAHYEYEAEIDIAGHPMLEYVFDALRGARQIRRIVIIGPSSLKLTLEEDRCMILEPGSSMLKNLQKAIERLSQDKPVLVVTCDIPLITPEAIEDFIDKCRDCKADIYYPVVSREYNEHKYPGVKRTYVTLKEGIFTGGNIFLMKPTVAYRCMRQLEQAIMLRKKPLQLCRMLGWRCFFKFIWGKLSIREIEKRIEKMLQIKGMAVISNYPEIGVDVDKPSDLRLVHQILNGAAKK
ncbi:MAG: NTP transferase domain-containing protein [Bacillota bacterium]